MEKTNSSKSDRKPENLRINLGYLQLKLKYSEVSEYFSNFGVIKQLYIPQKPDERSAKTNTLIQSYIVCQDKSTFFKMLTCPNPIPPECWSLKADCPCPPRLN